MTVAWETRHLQVRGRWAVQIRIKDYPFLDYRAFLNSTFDHLVIELVAAGWIRGEPTTLHNLSHEPHSTAHRDFVRATFDNAALCTGIIWHGP